jgi:hypothetical protein
MEARVTWDGKYSGIAIDWQRFVLDPANKGYFAQAFAGADSIIDNTGESILRQIFNSFESQTLINHLHNIKGRVGFDGMAIFLVLKNKDVLDEKLYSKISKFKKSRNLVLHNIEAEYKLIDYSEMKDISNQTDYDRKVQEKANEHLREAFGIFEDLLAVMDKVHGHEKEYLMKGLGSQKKAK